MERIEELEMPLTQSEVAGPDYDDFWGHFQLFPWRFVDRIYSSLGYLAAITLLPYLALVAPIWLNNINYLGDFSFWTWFLEHSKEWVVIVLGLIVVCWTFVRWRPTIPVTFQWLLESWRISSKSEDTLEAFYRYLNDYQAELRHKTKCFSFVAVAWIVLISNRLFTSQGTITSMIVLLIWGFFVGLAAWPIFVTGKYIKKLPETFDLLIQPSHPDKCGGFKPLGDFCFSMVLPLVLGGLVLAAFGIGGAILLAIYPDQMITEQVRLYIDQSDVIVANLAIFIFAFPLTMGAFLLPLREIHASMLAHKIKMENDYAERVSRLQAQILTNIDQDGSLEIARLAKDRLEIMQALDPEKLNYPVWPFKPNTFLKLVSPQILGVIGTVISVYQTVTAFFPE